MEPDKRTLPGEQSQAYRLLSLIAFSGEMPVSQIHRLSGGEQYKIKIIKSLKSQGLIVTHYRDGLRGFRLTKKAKELLLADNDSRFSFFVDGGADTNLLKSEVTRRIRLHRISETYITMLNAGVSIFRDEKPDIFYPDDFDMQPPAFDGPAFYSSREVKELGDDSIRVRGSRAVGTLLTDSNIYIVYNSGGSLMKWGRKAELRFKTLMRVVLCQERLPELYRPDDIYGLVMGDDMELLYKMLTSTGGEKRSYFMLDDYEVVEGTCIGVSSKPFGKHFTVKIMDDAGLENSLRLGKQSKVKIGFRYRFYFKQGQRLSVGSQYFDTALSSDYFLGFEELGKPGTEN